MPIRELILYISFEEVGPELAWIRLWKFQQSQRKLVRTM